MELFVVSTREAKVFEKQAAAATTYTGYVLMMVGDQSKEMFELHTIVRAYLSGFIQHISDFVLLRRKARLISCGDARYYFWHVQRTLTAHLDLRWL